MWWPRAMNCRKSNESILGIDWFFFFKMGNMKEWNKGARNKRSFVFIQAQVIFTF